MSQKRQKETFPASKYLLISFTTSIISIKTSLHGRCHGNLNDRLIKLKQNRSISSVSILFRRKFIFHFFFCCYFEFKISLGALLCNCDLDCDVKRRAMWPAAIDRNQVNIIQNSILIKAPQIKLSGVNSMQAFIGCAFEFAL